MLGNKKKIQKQYQHYKSIEFLPLWNYYQITDSESPDLRYLLKLDDYESLPETDAGYLQSCWDDIQYQVSDIAIKYDREAEILFEERKRLSLLQLKHFEIQNLISSLTKEKNVEHLKRLAHLGFAINPKKDYTKELVRVHKKSQGLRTRMGLLQSNIDNMAPKTGGKQIDILSVINKIEEHRPSLNIDPHTMPLKKWLLLYYKVNSEISQKKKRHGR